MYNYRPANKDKQLYLVIPGAVLNSDLSINEKYLLGLDFALLEKSGFNSYLHTQVSRILKLHPNIIAQARKTLVQKGLLLRNNRKYTLSQFALDFQENDKGQIILPFDLYTSKGLSTGAKLLWGVYNYISRGLRDYFALRETTATKMNVSVGSITNWTKELNQKKFLKMYKHKTGYCTSQTIVVTCTFVNGRPDLVLNREKDQYGNWKVIMPLLDL